MKVRHFFCLVCFQPFIAIAQVNAGPTEKTEKIEIVDRTVASIDGQVITLSQLEFEARVLFIHAGKIASDRMPLDRGMLAAGLNAIINERLATLHVDRLKSNPVEMHEVEKAIAAFRARFASEAHFRAFLTQHEASLKDVSGVLFRSLRAQRALEEKLRVQVTQADIESRRAVEPKLKSVADATIKQRLKQERFQQLVHQELERIQRDVDVRLHGPFSEARVAQ